MNFGNDIHKMKKEETNCSAKASNEWQD